MNQYNTNAYIFFHFYLIFVIIICIELIIFQQTDAAIKQLMIFLFIYTYYDNGT